PRGLFPGRDAAPLGRGAQLTPPPARFLAIETILERSRRPVDLEGLLGGTSSGAAREEVDVGARNELGGDRAEVLGVDDLARAGHGAPGIGDARLCRELLELAEGAAGGIDHMDAHGPQGPVAGPGAGRAPGGR